ncbi:hypothetical protein AKJ09_02654 [Labilithrix luteola]|uniref:Uncharacterized protein n=1 Tax=Labilithrix luteola TaxID=1391654 RepID=A0A0K1PR23_9BACT|nr:hypothetical protein AKJ09_02654 [Labilithrix luteola]
MAAPPEKVAEVIDGVLHLFPRPAKPHAAASAALGEELGPPFKRGRGGPGGWILLDEPELHLVDVIIDAWADDVHVRAEPFDAIELDLSVLWADVQL